MNAQIIAAMCLAAATVTMARQRPLAVDPPLPVQPTAPTAWALREELRLGADPGPEDDLFAVRGIVVSPTGTVFALDHDVIRIFPPRARPRRAQVPRPPSSDNALGVPVAMGSFGDHLWVFQAPRLVTVLDTAGSVLRHIAYHGARPIQGAGRARELVLGDSTFIALLGDGSFLRTMSPPGDDDPAPPARMYVLPLPGAMDTSVRGTSLLVRAAENGEAIQGLEVLTGPWSDARVTSPYGHPATVPQPFQDHQLVGIAPGGAEAVVVERFAATDPDRAGYSVIRFQSPSWKRAAHRFSYQPAPVTPAELDSAIARIVNGPGPGVSSLFVSGFPSRAAATAAVRGVVRRPVWHAPVSDMIVGSDRTVWLREHRTGRWVAHTPDGRAAGFVVLAPGARLIHAGHRTLWAMAPLSAGREGQHVLIRYRIVGP